MRALTEQERGSRSGVESSNPNWLLEAGDGREGLNWPSKRPKKESATRLVLLASCPSHPDLAKPRSPAFAGRTRVPLLAQDEFLPPTCFTSLGRNKVLALAADVDGHFGDPQCVKPGGNSRSRRNNVWDEDT